MAKHLVNFRLSQIARDKLAALRLAGGENKTALVERAIGLLYQAAKSEKKACLQQKPPALQQNCAQQPLDGVDFGGFVADFFGFCEAGKEVIPLRPQPASFMVSEDSLAGLRRVLREPIIDLVVCGVLWG